MKQLKMLGFAALAAAALTALLAPGAGATTLEVGGVTQNESIGISISLKPGTSANLKDTFGFSSNTCLNGSGGGSTESPYSGTTVTGSGLGTPEFNKCTREPIVNHSLGTLHVQHIAGTTNGTLVSSGGVVTAPSPFGTLTCETGEATHIGTLTGASEGHAEFHINATVFCSGISSKLIATGVVTSPTGLGISA